MEAGLHAIQDKRDMVSNKDFLVAFNSVSMTKNANIDYQNQMTYK